MKDDNGNLDIAPLRPADADDLRKFFLIISADPETTSYFHPHPFTAAFAEELCCRAETRRDLFYLARLADRVVAYSMLRGWDDGYSIPSFGICVHPEHRKQGIGKAVLLHAIDAARKTQVPAMRLTVYKANERAARLYESLGFQLTEKNNKEWLGILNLRSGRCT